jgi:large subunit ribosomal protein L25
MSDDVTFAAEIRERVGKGGARTVRRQGRLPAVIYGDKLDPLPISLDPRAVELELHKPGFFTRMFDIAVDGKTHRVLARDLQVDPVTDRPIHIDFLRFAKNAEIHIAIPVVFRNEESCPGLKRGGVLNIVRHEIEVICRIGNIPQQLEVDLEGLDIGDSVHIGSINIPEGATPTIADRDFTIATVAAPTVKAAEEAEAAEAAEAEEGAEGAEAEGTEAEAEAEGAKEKSK